MTGATPIPSAEARSLSAGLAAALTAAVGVTILALHAIKPEFEPTWRFLSEYAIGDSGWVMQGAFFLWAASCAALAAALWNEVGTLPGKIGVVMLGGVVVGLVGAGVFVMDPVTINPENATHSGRMHGLASMLGIPGLPIAAMLISASLVKTGKWAPHRKAVMLAAHTTWISLVLMMVYVIAVVPKAGGFTENTYAGLMNRLVVAAYLAWQWVVARRIRVD